MKRERYLKMWLRVSAIIFQLFKLIMLEKCALTILELKEKFSFIKRVDKGWITTVKDLESWRFER